MGLFKLVKNHPKKSVFALASAYYLFQYANEKYSEDVLRRQCCESIKAKSFEPVSPTSQLRRLTVFLNPFARHGSLLKEFDKNVAPMLQLSGLDVQMVYTDSDVEAKDYVRVLDSESTDGILVAGDDHVLQKVITALLERPEFTSGIRQMPVGIVPMGVWNAFAASAVGRQDSLRWCFSMLTPLLNESVQTQNVLEITTLPPKTPPQSNESDNHSDPSIQQPSDLDIQRTAFSLSGLEWSIWRDVEHGGGIGAPKAKSKPADPNDHRGLLPASSPPSLRAWTRRVGAAWRHAWFWLKSTPELSSALMLHAANTTDDSKLSFFRVNAEAHAVERAESVTRKRLRSKYARLVYTPACDGCSKCWSDRIRHLQSSSNLNAPAPTRPASMFSRMLGLSPAKSVGSKSTFGNRNKRLPEDRSHIQNEECGREYTVELSNTAGVIVALDGNNIRVDLIASPKSFLSYMNQAFSWLSGDSYRQVLVPDSNELNGRSSLSCSTVRLYPKITQNEFYWIDNEHFEACPVEIRVRINALDFYR